MNITIETSEGKALVRLDGILDSYIAEEMGDKFESLHDLEDTEITLDCTKLEYIASSGLRLFLLLLRNTKPNGCKIVIKGTSPEVMEIFKETGFVSEENLDLGLQKCIPPKKAAMLDTNRKALEIGRNQ